MIKNLYITNIPKDETKFKEMLDILGDDWGEYEIVDWLQEVYDYVYYSKSTSQYDYGVFHKEDLTEITYEEFMKKYQVKEVESITKEIESEIIEFDYDKIMQEKIVIHCKTKEQAINLLTWADSIDLVWESGDSYLCDNNWEDYKGNTCYNLFSGTFSDLDWYMRCRYEILSYKEAVNFDEVKNTHFDFDKVKKFKETEQSNPTGGSSNYYDLPKNAKTLQDLIEYKNMNAQQKDIFKACWRMGSKEGTKEEYDVRKQVYYSLRELGRLLGTKNYMKLAKDIIGEQSEED